MERSHYLINGEVVQLCEYIKNRLYFVTLSSRREPKSTPDAHFFSTDDELVYVNYYSDFGPLNLGCLYRYCVKLNTKLKCFALGKKKIIHYTSSNPQKRANAAFLIASYAIIYLKLTPRQAYRPLLTERSHTFRPFQDATLGASVYQIHLSDCLDGIYRALQHGFFCFEDFDLEEYERYEKIEHGDLNWIIPNKFLAFCGPSTEVNTSYKPPEHYFDYFHLHNVTTIIRLNKKTYDARSFTNTGFFHYDLYFLDGSVPSQSLTNKFLEICETTCGAIAVHCKAGLGRTGSLIGAYMMKHYRMTAKESIAWLRICRPGSVIGRQQAWLEEMEGLLWRTGDIYRIRRHGHGDCLPHHTYGIYSIAARKHHDKVTSSHFCEGAYKLNGSSLDKLSTGNCLKHLLGGSFTDDHEIADSKILIRKPGYKKKPRVESTDRNNNVLLGRHCPKCDKLYNSHHSPSAASCLCDGTPTPHKNYSLKSGDNMFADANKLQSDDIKETSQNKTMLTQGDRLNAIKLMRPKDASSITLPASKEYSG